MDVVARLTVASERLRRQIWGSLPWRVRVADLLMRLAVSTAEAFGKTVFQLFKKQGVTGMPEPSDHAAKEFGSMVFKMLIAKFGRQLGGDVEDVMSSFLVRLWKGADNIKPGTEFAHAKNIVSRGVINEGINYVKARKNKHEQGITREDDEGGESTVDFDDPDALHDMEGTVEGRELLRNLGKVKHDLERIDPDAPLYVELALTSGLSDKEIIGDPPKGVPGKLPHYTKSLQNWMAFINPKIYKVLKEKIGDQLRS